MCDDPRDDDIPDGTVILNGRLVDIDYLDLDPSPYDGTYSED